MGEYIFIKTANTSRGGLHSDIKLLSKNKFMADVAKFFSKNGSYSRPTYRLARVDGVGAINMKSLRLNQFEAIFTPEEIAELAPLLEYMKGDYPSFLKVIHVKYGKQRD